MDDGKDSLDDEQCPDTGGAVDDLNLDHQDAVFPSDGSAPVNGENLEVIQNDIVTHDSSESVRELESNIGVQSGEEVEFNAAGHAEIEGANDDGDGAEDAETDKRASDEHSDSIDAEPCEPSSANDDGDGAEDAETDKRASDEQSDLYDAEPCEPSSANDDGDGAEDTETDKRASDEHSDLYLYDAEPCEPSSEVVDGARDTDVVDAPSPMDVDVAQPTETEITASDEGCGDSMEIEYATGAEDASGSTSCQLATDSSSNEKDRESPMAEDDDYASRQADDVDAEKTCDLQDSEDHAVSQAAVSDENALSQAAASDAADYDEVDASQSKVDRQHEVTDGFQDVDEGGNTVGLVEGDDFTVELQPDTSEQDSAAEADQPVAESEDSEKIGAELETHRTEESDEMSDNVKTTTSDASTAPPQVSSDSVCKHCLNIIHLLHMYVLTYIHTYVREFVMHSAIKHSLNQRLRRSLGGRG